MSVASKNVFAALGSDDEESDPRPVANPTTSKTEPKKTTTSTTPAASRGGARGSGERGGRGGDRGSVRGGRGGRGRGAQRTGYSNEDVYKDRAEVLGNRERDVDESRPRGRGRPARASGSGRGREFDRHSATGRVDTQKATNQGWGNETTSWESAAPIAEEDRNAEKKDADEPATAPEGDAAAAETSTSKAPVKEPEEEEDHTQTYTDWLSSKDKANFSINEVRKPDQSKWESATSLLSKKDRSVEEPLFGEPSAQKTKTTSSSSTRKSSGYKKVVLEIEQRFTPIRSGRGGDRGGRGGGDRSRGTGERGGRGRGAEGGFAPRGGGRGRGDERGGRGPRGGYSGRGGGRGGSQAIDVADTTAFPALG